MSDGDRQRQPRDGTDRRPYPNYDDNDRRRSPLRDRPDAYHRHQQNYHDGYRSRQDYSRSPKRVELSYDDAQVDERRDDDNQRRRAPGYRDHGERDSEQRSLHRGSEHGRGSDSQYRPSRSAHRREDYEARGGEWRGRNDFDNEKGTRSSSRDDERGYGRRQDDKYGSRHEHDGHHRRDRSFSPMRHPGTPSDTVMLEGLPFGVSSDEVHDSLARYCSMSRYSSFDIRVPPGQGRRAFLQFGNVDDAMDFVQDNYPKLILEFPVAENPEGIFPVYIHYARNRDEHEHRGGSGSTNWTCHMCDFSNYPSRHRCKNCGTQQTDMSQYRHILTGESDASDTPSQILVFFPLASSVTEEVLAVGAGKLELAEKPSAPKSTGDNPMKLKSTAPTGDTSGYGARRGSLHRVFLMRDRDSKDSFKFGFAEFWTVEDALAAVTKFKKFREYTIASAPVTVSTIHLGVFVPELRTITPTIEAHSFHPLFNPDIRVKYWDPHVYPSEKKVTDEAPLGTKNKEGDDEKSGGESKKTKKRKAEGNLQGSAASAMKKPTIMAGQMAMWQKKHTELHEGKQRAGEDAMAENERELSRAGDRVPVKISLSGSPTGGQLNKPTTTPSGSAPASISPPAPSQEAPPIPSEEPPSASPYTNTEQGGGTGEKESRPVSYVDHDKICCLLCMMKYKSLDDLGIHEKSRNHKTAMEDQDKVKAAMPRLAARDKRLRKEGKPLPSEQDHSATTGSQYRDRAKERREVYNQPSKPSSKPSRKDKDSKAAGTARDPSPPVAAATAAPAQAKSKGSAMLAKMGWTAGEGLGANGEGRTEVVETHAYQEGVGLGAEGGKLGDAAELAQRKTTNSYADYLNTAQDKARERYNRMGG